MTLRAMPVWLASLLRQLKSSYLGLTSPPACMLPFLPPHRPRLAGVSAVPGLIKETWPFPASWFSCAQVSHVFLLPLPGSPRLPPSLNLLPLCDVCSDWSWLTSLPMTPWPFTCIRSFPFLPSAPSHIHKYIKITI